jgi:Glycosyltransferase family 87
LTAKRSPLRILAAICLLAIGLSIIVLVTSQSSFSDRDFTAYFAIGRQLLAHRNPYAQSAFDPWKAAGVGHIAIVRYPPGGLLFSLLLTPFSLRTAGILWVLLLIAALMISIRLLRQMMDSAGDRNHLLGYLFPPVLCCLMAGQIGILLLLAFTLFLYMHEHRPWIAGAVLSFCLAKPHLMALPLAVLLVWSVRRRRFQILGGGALALLVCSLIPLYFDPRIWSHYLAGFRGEHIENEFIPTLSCVFRLLVHRDWQLLQLVPLFCGLIWAGMYFWRRRDAWDWVRDGSFVMAVGVMVAPYAWITDEVLALPAVLFGIYSLQRTGRSIAPYVVFAVAGLAEVLFTVPPGSGLYLWTAPAWVAWSVYANRPVRLQDRAPATVDNA